MSKSIMRFRRRIFRNRQGGHHQQQPSYRVPNLRTVSLYNSELESHQIGDTNSSETRRTPIC